LQILGEYAPANSRDDTARILGAFVENLPEDGQVVLMQEIETFNPDQLRQLREFLVQAILRPSMFSKAIT
jgi:hypothetical protein